MVMLVGVVPLFYGLSVLTGFISYNFGSEKPPSWLLPSVLATMGLGALVMWVGQRLVSWGHSDERKVQ
jgi:hypothetical protein